MNLILLPPKLFAQVLRECAQHAARDIIDAVTLQEKQALARTASSHGHHFNHLVGVYLHALATAQLFCGRSKN